MEWLSLYKVFSDMLLHLFLGSSAIPKISKQIKLIFLNNLNILKPKWPFPDFSKPLSQLEMKLSIISQCLEQEKVARSRRNSPEWWSSADKFWLFSDGTGNINTSEESMMFHTFLPKVFTMIPLIKIKFHNVLVVTLKSNKLQLKFANVKIAAFSSMHYYMFKYILFLNSKSMYSLFHWVTNLVGQSHCGEKENVLFLVK